LCFVTVLSVGESGLGHVFGFNYPVGVQLSDRCGDPSRGLLEIVPTSSNLHLFYETHSKQFNTMESPKHTIVVTGAAGGIGGGFLYEFLQTPLASTHHGIYVAHPSEQDKLEKLLDLHAPSTHSAEIYVLDLNHLAAVRKFAAQIKAKIASKEIPPIRSLYLIAGGVFTSQTSEDGIDYSDDGFEKMFAVNYLANFFLVLLLLDSMDKQGARIVFVSSTTHDPLNWSNGGHVRLEEHKLVWRDLEGLAKGKQEVVGSAKREKFEAAMRRYGMSKTLLNMFM